MQNILLILILCSVTTANAFADIVIIVNPANTVNWDTEKVQNYVKEIFLNTKEKFPDGTTAKPVDQFEGKPIRQEFYSKIAGKDETGMNVYWSKLIFTGNGRPPKVIGDDDSVKRFIVENVNAIGYINSNSVDKTVKVIYSIK